MGRENSEPRLLCQTRTTRNLASLLYLQLKERLVYCHLNLRRRDTAKTIAVPPHPLNSALVRGDEIVQAASVLAKLKLGYRYDHPAKVWDGYRFFSFIMTYLTPSARILDMGSGPRANVLCWLQLCGYRDLWATDVIFKKPSRRGFIHYSGEDMRNTGFDDRSFECVICQSAIEHGNDPKDFLREVTRILKPNGYLLLSADYWPDKIHTGGLVMYGVPWTIFSKSEILDLVAEAVRNELELIEPISLSVGHPIISTLGKEYTFIFLSFRKKCL